jgi:hypothetical protein
LEPKPKPLASCLAWIALIVVGLWLAANELIARIFGGAGDDH